LIIEKAMNMKQAWLKKLPHRSQISGTFHVL